ncbi:hypothetical protein [Paraburkholderia sp. SIMBA_030]|uniref:hypothetical protein n=1 Tax=Paraburkholderia sp. SIMBA_030 TaxID=3085773 RepID=UPI00397AF25A
MPPAATAPAHGLIPLDDVPLNAFHIKIAGLTSIAWAPETKHLTLNEASGA